MTNRILTLDVLDIPEEGPVAEVAGQIARTLVIALAGLSGEQYEMVINHVLAGVMEELQAQGSTLEEAEHFANVVNGMVGLIEYEMTGGGPMAAPSVC